MAIRRLRAFVAVASMAAVTAVAGCASLLGLAGGDAPDTPDAEAGTPDASPACDADLESDPASCGACGHVCITRSNGAPTCVHGACANTCNTGFGDCDGDPTNGCETNEMGDPKNCGACAHDCLGGACEQGTCQLVTLLAERQLPQGLATDGTSLYWTEYPTRDGGVPGSALRCPIASCAAGLEVLDNQLPGTFGFDATSVYWARVYAGEIVRAPRDGGAFTPIVVGESLPFALATTDAGLMWNELSTVDAGYANGQLVTAHVDGTAEAVVVAGLKGPSEFPFVADGARVYFVDHLGIQTCPIPCVAGAQVLITPAVSPSVVGLALDATSMYWIEYGQNGKTGRVMRARKDGSDLTVMASGIPELIAIALDDSGVYFVNRTDKVGQVAMCPRTGCPASGPIVLAALQDNPTSIALTDLAVYWTNMGANATSGDGTLNRIAKRP